ncbi:BTAD domain-containing putative transcriptional regulator [Phycicoccus sp. Soil748]|uniref:nSTAND1 domain-containing NTPase n=1 Tax=Phycicoccus sp. Soil748 TaxID=1736397 RepID=UPI0007028224|nr:BTAD domain-containing putative transcriptional regulator [Phycicoccus sp. Soil748]KRE58792.1 hypothetical protein ASG70_16200 [Phycicoccus sp. Soil748]
MSVRIALLGSLEVDGGRTTLGKRDRVVLQALAVRPGTDVSPEALADCLWGEHVPETWHKVVQGCIVRLRKAVGADAIQTSPRGYRLLMHRDELDHLYFEHLVSRARDLLADGNPERALYVTGLARGLWRGEPLVDLADWAPGRIAAEQLTELWRDTEELHAEALLRVGRYEDVLGEAVRLVAEEPQRERRWGLLALAQYQAGRQGDALQTLQRAKALLVDELGVDPGRDLTDLETGILRQDPALLPPPAVPPTSTECPYLGLAAYDIDDAPGFFGRRPDTAACLRRLDGTGALAVVGPSGCGKSSLVRAGVAAALTADGRRVTVMTPGVDPLISLEAVDLAALDALVVDQCEEAFNADSDSPDRAEFFDRLGEIADNGRCLLVVSLRADRLGELATHPDFARLVERGLYLLGAMTPPDLRLAIEGPAQQAGLRLEPGLVDLLVREVAGEPSALPMLSHVLRQTWRRREGQTLTVAGYQSTGGIQGAISHSAESLFGELTAAQRRVLRDLMVRLVGRDDSGKPVRQRLPRRAVETDEDHSLVVQRLVSARLLSADGDTVEIAHETLAVAWPRLRSWLDDDVDGLRIVRQLTLAATSWDGLGRPDSELYRGVRRAAAQEWRERTHPSLSAVEQDFLDASDRLHTAEQEATEAQVRTERRSNQRLRAGLATVAVLLAVAIVAGALAKNAANRADQQAVAADEQALTADARRLGAEGLRAADLDRSLLLSAAGVRLHDSVDTRTNLLATLDRAHQLLRTHRTGTAVNLTVNPATGQVALAMPFDGVALFDGSTLQELHHDPQVRGPGLVSSPDGHLYAASLMPELTGEASDPPAVTLLDERGAVSSVQLGGVPSNRYAQQELSFSPNGRWLVVGLLHREGAAPPVTVVWDLTAPGRPAALVQLGDQDHSPVVSDDGRTLYGAGGGHVRVVDLAGGRGPVMLDAADLDVREVGDQLRLHPDGRTLAVGAGDEVALLDTHSLTTRAVLSGHGRTDALAFSRDGRRLASAGEEVVAWDLSGGQPRELLRHEDPSGASLGFSPDARTLYTVEQSGLLLAWDLDGDRSFLRTHPGEALAREAPAVIRFSPDRRKIGYVWGSPAAVQVRDGATGALGPLIDVRLRQRSWIDLAWSPDSRHFNVTTGDGTVGIWDATTGRNLASHTLVQAEGSTTRPGPTGATEGASIAFWSLDGRFLLVGSTTGRLHVLDGRTLAPVHEPVQVTSSKEGGRTPPVQGLEPSPDLRTVVTFGDQTRVVDYVDGVVEPPLGYGGDRATIAFAPRGGRALVGTSSGEVGIVDTARRRWLAQPAAVPPFPGYSVVWSPDGSRVATTNEGQVGWWDRSGTFQGSIKVPDAASVAFSDDGRRLHVADDQGGVHTWDLDPAEWVRAACLTAGRDLTVAEWRSYLPGRPTQSICG